MVKTQFFVKILTKIKLKMFIVLITNLLIFSYNTLFLFLFFKHIV